MLRGEIWQLRLGGKTHPEHTRPVVILSSDAMGVLPLRVVVPLISWEETYKEAPWMVHVPPVLRSGLEKAQAADTLQIRSVATSLLVERAGELPVKIVDEIARAAAMVIGCGDA